MTDLINTADLPLQIREKLAELDIELSEGDITEKGYSKKKSKILEPYLKQKKYASHESSPTPSAKQISAASGATPSAKQISAASGAPNKVTKKDGRRYTRDEVRYRSDIREEAVKEALARSRQRDQAILLPSKRREHTNGGSGGDASVNSRPQQIEEQDSESEDEEDNGDDMACPTPASRRKLTSKTSVVMDIESEGRAHSAGPNDGLTDIPSNTLRRQQQNSSTGSQSSGSGGIGSRLAAGLRLGGGDSRRGSQDSSSSTQDQSRAKGSFGAPPDVTHNTGPSRRVDVLLSSGNLPPEVAAAIDNYASHSEFVPVSDRQTRNVDPITASQENLNLVPNASRVSDKILQLVNTLKRPKRAPLPEFFQETIDEQVPEPAPDPNAPQPKGNTIEPAVAEEVATPSGLPRTLEAALQRYATASPKSPMLTCLDCHAKPTNSITYAKLLQKSYRIAYLLLNKLGHRGELSLKPRDRVALVYTNNDPINFICAFYGCLTAGVVPLAIEVPLMRRDAGCQSMGFLLSSQDIRIVLTSEQCFKALPRSSTGEVDSFSGWPKVHWINIDHSSGSKPAKDWCPPDRMRDDETAYMEYVYGRDGSVRSVMISRGAMLAHCRALSTACNYQEDDALVSVVDCKRENGLWHAVLASVFNGMHVIFVPYSVMKVEPGSWLRMVSKFKATTAIVKSRDMHWALLSEKDHASVELSSLKMLLVADGSNPWSLTSCDSFVSKLSPRGLRPDAICPCAASSETLTLCLRRPSSPGPSAPPLTAPSPVLGGGLVGQGGGSRGVLSMQSLSYGVVRVDAENSLTSLTLQDCGRVLQGGTAVVVKPTGSPYLCKTDEVGEICLASDYTGVGYWGLMGQSNVHFKVQPLYPDGQPISESQFFTRTGLLGFLGPASSRGLIFICGSREGMMTVGGRRHNSDDVIATALAVEPMKIVYRGRISVFSIPLLKDERIVIVSELRQGFNEEACFKWMTRVLLAIDTIHQVNVYCLALVPQNYLPKTPLGGIHVHETRRRFLEGSLHPCNVLLCPHSAVTNLPQPREIRLGQVGPSAMMVGSLVAGARLASASGREIGGDDDPQAEGNKKHQFLSDILQWRAQHTPDDPLYSMYNTKMMESSTLTCQQLHKKAEKIGSFILEKGKVAPGAHVALIYPPGIDLISGVYGCLYAGCVPVPIKPPHPDNLATTLETVKMIVKSANVAVILTHSPIAKLLKSKDAQQHVKISELGVVLDTDDSYRKKLSTIYKAMCADELAYLDYSISTTGVLGGVRMTHATASALCHAQKLQCEFYPTRVAILCLEPYSGLGFVLWCLASIYCGHHCLLVSPQDMEVAPWLWLTLASTKQVRDTFCSYSAIELSTKALAKEVVNMKTKGVSLESIRSLVIVGEERPRIQLTTSFNKLFACLGLNHRAVSTSFGCRVCPAICLQGTSSPETSTVYVDTASLRNDRIKLLEKGSPNSLCLMESGKLLPGVRVVIANPETKGHCADSQLGEIWVTAPHTAAGYFSLMGSTVPPTSADPTLQVRAPNSSSTDPVEGEDHFSSHLTTGDKETIYARTGYLGFVRRTELTQSDGGRHDALYIVGALDEALMLRGMRYHPIDIENTMMRCHKKIAECAVFSWTNLAVAVVELDGAEWEAMDLIHPVTSAVLEDHLLILGVVVVVDPASIPVNSRGEKQRMHLRDAFINDKLDPIYVSYNM